MPSKFKFELNDAKARAKLKALVAAQADMKPAFVTIGRAVRSRILLCFKLGIDPWGSPWAALKFRKGQPLKDRNLTGLSRIVANSDSTGVTIGTVAPGYIAETHQFGKTIYPKNGKRLVFPGPGGRLIFAKKVTIPARPFFPLKKGQQVVALPPSWSADVTRAIRAYFKTAVDKATA